MVVEVSVGSRLVSYTLPAAEVLTMCSCGSQALEEGVAHKFYLDGFCTLLPEGALGNTWRGVTPEERTLLGNDKADVSVVSNGVAITVTVTTDPVNTKTTVSEIVLPSFERMAETYVIKAY